VNYNACYIRFQNRIKKNKDLIKLKEKPFTDKKTDAKNDIPSGKIMVNESYARFGWYVLGRNIFYINKFNIVLRFGYGV
jgi:hypothetical protein